MYFFLKNQVPSNTNFLGFHDHKRLGTVGLDTRITLINLAPTSRNVLMKRLKII